MTCRLIDGKVSLVAFVGFQKNNHRMVDRRALVGAAVHLAPPTYTASFGYPAGKPVMPSRFGHQGPRTEGSELQRSGSFVSPVLLGNLIAEIEHSVVPVRVFPWCVVVGRIRECGVHQQLQQLFFSGNSTSGPGSVGHFRRTVAAYEMDNGQRQYRDLNNEHY